MNIVHGTHNTYQRLGCRCEICKAFRAKWASDNNKKPEQKAKHNEYMKQYHAQRFANDSQYREQCREVKRKAARKMRSDPEKRQKDNQRALIRMRARRDMIQKIKLERGCTDCGYKEHPEALDFHHLDGKVKVAGVSRIKTLSLENLMAEIAKCEVVCANCHRVRSYK